MEYCKYDNKSCTLIKVTFLVSFHILIMKIGSQTAGGSFIQFVSERVGLLAGESDDSFPLARSEQSKGRQNLVAKASAHRVRDLNFQEPASCGSTTKHQAYSRMLILGRRANDVSAVNVIS